VATWRPPECHCTWSHGGTFETSQVVQMLSLIKASLEMWDILRDFMLSHEEDRHTWRFDNSGTFSSKSVYRAFFQWSITFEPWLLIWKTWAPPKCKVFLWLLKNRCWTAGCLSKWCLQHPKHCVLYNQEEETTQHILTSCVFSWEFWFRVLAPLSFLICVRGNRDLIFAVW
jgi:hypothetical protein